MGVDATDYVIVGIKTKFNEIEKKLNFKEDSLGYEELEERFKDIVKDQYKAKIGDFAYISDGMNGEYAVLGVIVDKAELYDGEGMDMVDCLKAYEKYKLKVSENLRKMGITFGEISVYAFTHYH